MTYEHLPKPQRDQLTYGGKIRYARCLISNAQSALKMYPGMFTDEEISQIEAISYSAIERAKADYTAAGGRPAPVDSVNTGEQPEG